MNRLSKSMRQKWQDQGYLHLKNVISKDEAAGYLDAANEVIEGYEAENPKVRKGGVYTIIQTLFRTDGIDGLMDHPNLFGIILDLMGPYLQIMGSQIYVRYPSEGKRNLSGWHTDAGRSLAQIRVAPDSLPLNFKIQFFLTDIPEENHANFCLVPRSHHRPVPEGSLSRNETPPGGFQLIAEVGDCAIFPNTLWHAVAPNHSDIVRRSITFRYGQMWCRPYDYEKCPEDVLARMTTRQRRLMGDLGECYTATDYFKPKDQIEVIMDGLDFECPNI
ncbi:MAG: phytanoyl-CoA dioxygenase family protein [Candidatus Poribacteria bacterium]|nr:hypothetical protein [Candidatus Poribacteria bacterium]HIM10505.1 hypothetical protein [Candidatus Poribacteria bacterium]HIO50183.1 hypothetical protein [Candidatus Poribacteria bacterium]HIO80067.1 hypothetical protein [Candidatus Poribacteria bacterium]